jgi:hypothetical protein
MVVVSKMPKNKEFINMKDRFNLEDEIIRTNNFGEDIDLVVEYIADSDIDCKVKDNTINMLIGIKGLIHVHADRLLDTMCQCLKLDQYNKQESHCCNNTTYCDDMPYI